MFASFEISSLEVDSHHQFQNISVFFDCLIGKKGIIADERLTDKVYTDKFLPNHPQNHTNHQIFLFFSHSFGFHLQWPSKGGAQTSHQCNAMYSCLVTSLVQKQLEAERGYLRWQVRTFLCSVRLFWVDVSSMRVLNQHNILLVTYTIYWSSFLGG